MAGGYSQHFTLAEIFNNKKLRNKIPLVNYKERTDESGSIHRTTSMKTISRFVYDKSVSAARPFYEPLKPHKAGNLIVIGGNLVGDQNEAVEAIYARLLGEKAIMEMTANNAEMIRSAVKEAERDGNPPKLYLKQVTMEQIESLDKKGVKALIQDIMQNLFYSGNYPKTEKKFGVENLTRNYTMEQARWKRKVGAL